MKLRKSLIFYQGVPINQITKKKLNRLANKTGEPIEYTMLDEGEWPQCLHSRCDDCKGSGVKKDGQMCIHSISCQCKKHHNARH